MWTPLCPYLYDTNIYIYVLHDEIEIEWRPLGNILDIVDNLLQHGAYVDRYWQCHTPWGTLWENLTSSTTPEVHNVFYCRVRRTEPRPRMYGNFVKFGRVVLRQASGQTDRQTDTSQYFARPKVGEVTNLYFCSVWLLEFDHLKCRVCNRNISVAP